MDKLHIISDCDGILTSANLQYGTDGKNAKFFSVNDSLMVDFFKKYYSDRFDFTVLTGDKGAGLEITAKRLAYMGVDWVHCKNENKYAHIKQHYDISKVIYIGDDIYDIAIFKECAHSATVCNAPSFVKKYAKHISVYEGGKNALTDILYNIAYRYGLGADLEQKIINHVKQKEKTYVYEPNIIKQTS